MSGFDPNLAPQIRKAAEIILSSQRTVVLTGAGVSTPSGIPDFRSMNFGLWQRINPWTVASLSAFRYQPQKFYEWFQPLAVQIFNAAPNPSHNALADLEEHGFLQAIITQNINRLHQKAGSQHVFEVHGSLNTLSCGECYQQYPASLLIPPYIEHGEIPECPDCKRILKPDVILIDEQLPAKSWLAAKKNSEDCDVMIIAGSSLVVMPVAELPQRAYRNQARIIIVNQSETYIDTFSDVVIRRDVAEILPAIAHEVLND